MKSRNPLIAPLFLACLIGLAVLGDARRRRRRHLLCRHQRERSDPATITAPWRTLHASVPRLRAGDTLFIRGGIYGTRQDNVDSQAIQVPSGTSWSAPITIAGYAGETVTLRPPDGYPGLRLRSAPRTIWFSRTSRSTCRCSQTRVVRSWRTSPRPSTLAMARTTSGFSDWISVTR